jgi:hypothetical protein
MADSQYVGEFSTPMVVVSNQLLDGYCTESGGTKSCRAMPIRSLDPSGVVLQWSEHGFPGWTFGGQDGRVINIDGRPAKITEQNAVCGPMGSDRSLTVIVTRPGIRDNWYQLDACFREPGADAAIAEVMELLQTVQIVGR